MIDTMGRSQQLYKEAKGIIPGGTQLLSKRPEMLLPGLWPAYYSKAKGCRVWDLDCNEYTDMSYMGMGSCILGYAVEEVDRVVKSTIDKGIMSTLNVPEEVELGKLLIKLHPWADMVRYARTGGEAMSIAVRIARAKTKKDKILFCGYHGWHDWYLSANLADKKSLDGHLLPGLSPLGVPRKLKGTTYPFNFNDTEGFLRLFKKHKNSLGAVILEPMRNVKPDVRFFKAIREVTQKNNIVLIVDEITAGWRLTIGGAHLIFNLTPDIAVFAKGMSNGYPMAAVLGKENIMEAAQSTFISSTYWTERIGPTAAIVTITILKRNNVPGYLIKIGQLIQDGWKYSALKYRVPIEISGMAPLGHFDFRHEKSMALKTLFTQCMLEKGFLASNAFYASYAHKEKEINAYLSAVDNTFQFISKVLSGGNPERFLKGPVCHSGFKRLA